MLREKFELEHEDAHIDYSPDREEEEDILAEIEKLR